MPIYTHITVKDIFDDDFQSSACPYAEKVKADMYNNPNSYSQHNDLLERLREPISRLFQLPENEQQSMDFHTLTGLSDVVISRKFEGLQMGINPEFDIDNLTPE